MSELVPGLERHLSELARSLTDGAPRPRRRWRLAPALALGGLATASVAYGATQLWAPQLGSNERDGLVTAGDTALPVSQTNRLAVLRRPQTERDRSQPVRHALEYLPTSVSGVRIAGIRLLAAAPDGAPLALIPVERYQSPEGQVSDGLCLWLGDKTDGGSFKCASTAEALAGGLSVSVSYGETYGRPRAAEGEKQSTYLRLGATLHGGWHAGIVPDEVANVSLKGEPTARHPVDGNSYAFSATNMSADASEIDWYATTGELVNR